jgi:hypothetical protein
VNLDELKRVGRWPVRRLLGQGGFSWVFEVEDENLKVGRALKMLKPEAGEGEGYRRFWREARILASIEDPCLVRILELDRDQDTGNDYYVMELLTGRDLAKVLKDDGPMPIDRGCEVFLGVLQGLGRLHGQSPPVIHRDIKPGNIQITDDGQAKLLDLGIARMARTGDETVLGASEITTLASFMGTVKYASPEQLRVRELGPPSDVFSMGLCLFETLEGHHPYTDLPDMPTQSYQDVLGYYAQLEATRGSLALKFKNSPRPIQALIRRSLAIPVADRFQNAMEMRKALENAIGGRAPALPATRSKPGGSRTAMAAAAAGLAIVGAAGLFWWSPWSSDTEVVVPVRPSADAVASRTRVRDLRERVEGAAENEQLTAADVEPFESLLAKAEKLWDDGKFDDAARIYDEARVTGTKLLGSAKAADQRQLASAEEDARTARGAAQEAGATRHAAATWKQAEDSLMAADRSRRAGDRAEAIQGYAVARSTYELAAAEAVDRPPEPPPVRTPTRPPPNAPPILAVSPRGPLSLEVGERTVLVASARDPDGGGSTVEYTVRDPSGRTSRASGERYTFAPKASGAYAIEVVAKDSVGARSAPVRVTASVRRAAPPPTPPPTVSKQASPSDVASVLDEYAAAIRGADLQRLKSVWRMDANSQRLFERLFRSYGSLAVSVTTLSKDVRGSSASLRFTQSLQGVADDGRFIPIVEGPMLAELTWRGDYWQITSLKRAQ